MLICTIRDAYHAPGARHEPAGTQDWDADGSRRARTKAPLGVSNCKFHHLKRKTPVCLAMDRRSPACTRARAEPGDSAISIVSG